MIVWPTISDAIEQHGKCAMITQLSVDGSAPREPGARLIVMPDGTFTGTIGGGALEWHVLALAQTALRKTDMSAQVSRHALGPELGQCCGGVSRLLIETFDQSRRDEVSMLAAAEADGAFAASGEIGAEVVTREILPDAGITGANIEWDGKEALTEVFGDTRRNLYLFGAGHVGKAIVLALAPLPFEVTWIDPRRDAFPRAVPGNVKMVCASSPSDELAAAPDGSFVVVLTHSHALDQEIVQVALKADRFGYVGVIGSKTKRARFASRMRKAGTRPDQIDSLICPIGVGGITSKQPAVIAASVAAQLLEHDELVKNSQKPVQSDLQQVTVHSGR